MVLRMQFVPNSDIIWELTFNWTLCLESVGASTKGTQSTDAFSSLASKKAGGYSQVPRCPCSAWSSLGLGIAPIPQIHHLGREMIQSNDIGHNHLGVFYDVVQLYIGIWLRCKGIFLKTNLSCTQISRPFETTWALGLNFMMYFRKYKS